MVTNSFVSLKFTYLQVVEYELRKDCFSNMGSFGFGLQEHIDLGIKYDPRYAGFSICVRVSLPYLSFNISVAF